MRRLMGKPMRELIRELMGKPMRELMRKSIRELMGKPMRGTNEKLSICINWSRQ